MKLSSFVVITDPDRRQDPWLESIASAVNFSDEVVVVDGSLQVNFDENHEKLSRLSSIIKHVHYPWDQKSWSWSELPIHLNLGLKSCTGDWAIRFDADYIFPDEWKDEIKTQLEDHECTPVATFQKFSSVLSKRFYQKGAVRLGFNLKFRDLYFGRAVDKYTDMCVPIMLQGWDKDVGVPFGRLLEDDECGKCGMDFFNYDYAFKTEAFTRLEFHKFSMAHKKYYGYTKWGETPDEALIVFLEMMQGRLDRCPYKIPYSDQPVFIREKLGALTDKQFAHSGWGDIVENSSVHLVGYRHNKR